MFAWRDNNVVLFVTTVGNLSDSITRDRRRPAASRTGASQTRKLFGNNIRLPLDIPKLIDDYNHFMGGVDQFNQLRSYYSILRAHRKTWRPLFTLLVEIALVNSYKLATANRKTTHDAHRRWLLELVVQLKELAVRRVKRKRSPPPRTIPIQYELVRFNSGLRSCKACSDRGYQSFPGKLRKPLEEISSSATNYIRPQRPRRTGFSCKQCKTPLCGNPQRPCWSEHLKATESSNYHLQQAR